jgi:hypothetical protein
MKHILFFNEYEEIFGIRGCRNYEATNLDSNNIPLSDKFFALIHKSLANLLKQPRQNSLFMRNYLVFALFAFLCTGICRSQVPVSQEPRHHKILDNGHVRLLDVHIPPGDTTQYHIHATPSVFLLLTEANTGTEVISEEDRSNSPIPHYGNIWFEGFYSKSRIHRVYNRDTHEFRVMDIELTNKNYIVLDSPIKEEAFSFLFEEKPVRAYRFTPDIGRKIYLSPRKGDMLMIQLTDSLSSIRANKKIFKLKGDFLYIPSGTPFELINDGSVKAEFAFFELK